MSGDGKGKYEPVDAAVMPRFTSLPTFMRLPHVEDPAALDIALVGVPWDGDTTNRAGARHGPREIRNMSSFMRRVHPVSKIVPYGLYRCADMGDASVNPVDLDDTLGRVERFFARIHAAGAVPLTAGGDHLITLPIMRAIARNRPVGMIHFDAHCDTNDEYFAAPSISTARRSAAPSRKAC
jgi:guanidinopropionase